MTSLNEHLQSWGGGCFRCHVETAGAVIGRCGLLVWAAFSLRSLMQVEIVDSEHSIKEVEERLSNLFSNNKQQLYFANKAIAWSSSRNRSYLTAPPSLNITTSLKDCKQSYCREYY